MGGRRAAAGNLRATPIATSPSYKRVYEKRRCRISKNGFSEWRTIGKVQEGYAIGMIDGAPEGTHRLSQ